MNGTWYAGPVGLIRGPSAACGECTARLAQAVVSSRANKTIARRMSFLLSKAGR